MNEANKDRLRRPGGVVASQRKLLTVIRAWVVKYFIEQNFKALKKDVCRTVNLRTDLNSADIR